MSVKSSSAADYTPQLKQFMHKVGLKSFADLSRATGLSRTRIGWLRQGKIQDLRLGQVLQLSQTLEITLEVLFFTFSSTDSVELLTQCNPVFSNPNISVYSQTKSEPMNEYVQLQQTLETLKEEYKRQQKQLQNQQVQLWQEYQKSTVQALESLLLQWPTAAYAARKNPEAPAIKILPLLRPLEQLLASWGIIAIGEVGTEICYNPQWHQIMASGESGLASGDQVKVRYVGYRQGKQLLYRAKVSPLQS